MALSFCEVLWFVNKYSILCVLTLKKHLREQVFGPVVKLQQRQGFNPWLRLPDSIDRSDGSGGWSLSATWETLLGLWLAPSFSRHCALQHCGAVAEAFSFR